MVQLTQSYFLHFLLTHVKQLNSSSAMTIYIIDDNEIDLIIGQKLLERRDKELNLQVCQDPVLALEQLLDGSIQPDVILLDWHMPLLNADQWLTRYNQHLGASIPVYILTSSIDPRDQQKVEVFEAVKGFFSKPLTQTHMDEILKNQGKS